MRRAERDVVDRFVDRNCSNTSAGIINLTPVSKRQAPCVQLLREDCVQEDVPLEDLLYTEILSDKVISKPWGRSRRNPTFKTRVKRRTRRARRDQSSQPESKDCSLVLFALSLHAGHDSAGIHSNVAAARALRGVDTEVVDLIQGRGIRPRYTKTRTPECSGKRRERRGRKGGYTTGPIRGDTTTSHLTTTGEGQRAGTESGGAGSRVPGGCARAGGLSWGGVRGRARVAAVRTVSHIPAGPRFLY